LIPKYLRFVFSQKKLPGDMKSSAASFVNSSISPIIVIYNNYLPASFRRFPFSYHRLIFCSELAYVACVKMALQLVLAFPVILI
jgi:hypothetical protein